MGVFMDDRKLKLKAGSKISSKTVLYEGYQKEHLINILNALIEI